MRSVRLKILLWFLAVMTITAVGFVLTTAKLMQRPRGRNTLMARVLAYHAEEARRIYENQGREGLADYLDRAQRMMEARVILTDARGRDLLTGEDHGDLISYAGDDYRVPAVNARVIARETEDRRYWLLLLAPRNRPGFLFFWPQHLWIVAVVALLSYVLAVHLTSPVIRMRNAVERFGRGDLAARVKTGRKDEFGRLAATFNEMAERIEKLLSAERRLLLDISHELRSPLARLIVAAELARSGDNRKVALDRIEKEAERLNALVGELLQVTRAEGDPSTMRTEEVRLDELVREVVEDCDVEARVRRCRVDPELAGPLWVKGDPELLRRAVENVVRNAIRHAPADSAVKVATAAANGQARVVVRDYGPGIPEEHRDAIFQPFFRVEPDRGRASGGAGLGLSIARRAVELHHGTIAARNAHPGLVVEIDLPRQTPVSS